MQGKRLPASRINNSGFVQAPEDVAAVLLWDPSLAADLLNI